MYRLGTYYEMGLSDGIGLMLMACWATSNVLNKSSWGSKKWVKYLFTITYSFVQNSVRITGYMDIFKLFYFSLCVELVPAGL